MHISTRGTILNSGYRGLSSVLRRACRVLREAFQPNSRESATTWIVYWVDSFLEEEGIREEVEVVAVKRVISWQLAEAMRKKRITKQASPKNCLPASLSWIVLLDPQNIAVSLDTISRSAKALATD